MNAIVSKLKESLFSVLPITAIVILLHFTLTPISVPELIRFIIGSVLIVVGLTVFLLGVDICITPIGKTVGGAIVKFNKVWIVVVAGLALGFFISIAEPDLHIFAGQVQAVTSGLISKNILVVVVSVGVAILISIGLARIIYSFPLHIMLFILYGVILVLALFSSPEFLAFSFDASGATTGALTVPFILALAAGVSNLKKNSKSSENDSFGLVGIASGGAIVAVLFMSVVSKSDKITGTLQSATSSSESIFLPFLEKLPVIAVEVLIALSPILIFFLIFQYASMKMPWTTVRKILFGALFTFLGLVAFLLGVNAGFMSVGSDVGFKLASMDNKLYLIVVSFIIGLVTILAEPAVSVLTHQVEDVTSGYVKRKLVMATLSLGVASAITMSVLRILVPQISLWHFLLPGYIISIAMTFFVPSLFVGIAFDSGGVASGPMTATFILAFTQGAAGATQGADVVADGFGVIALVAMTPLIALQILGLIYKIKTKRQEIKNDT